ncbi:MAG TPA: sporulation protein YunB [Candidatus Onthousia excrementipullorum]|uniref:Sporulation protein YunB n=1 Tax=Candidatus Onthousia excrementipullorum TaxID=2840884 RepID=A0A9D1DVW0_9FIRM|nr:sporulation protein YunB [Candidatus Onthousia excrementipullorum]
MNKKKIYIFISLLILSFFIALYLTSLAGKGLEQVIVKYATSETERIANVILNDVVNIDDDYFNEDLFEISRDNDGNIELINFDTKVTNRLLKDINDKAMKRLSAIEKGDTTDIELSDSLKGTRLTFLDDGVVCDIPIGSLFHNGLIVNLTTSIPIRFSFIGTVSSNIVTDVKEYGFNNALIEVGIEVTIKEKITMPHSTESIPITTKVNLTTQLIQGSVPNYYNGAFSASSQVFATKIK